MASVQKKKVPVWQWLVVVAGVLVATRQADSIWRLWKSGQHLQIIQNQLNLAKEENLRLKRLLAEVDSPKFIERMARDKLGMAREGEFILILPDQNANPNTQASNFDQKPIWRQWWDLYVRI